jgi:two-component sensor histidine kinase
MLHGLERYQDAYDFISGELRRSRSFDNLSFYGQACAALKKYDEAVESFKDCIKRFPEKSNNKIIIYGLCKTLQESGKKEECQIICNKFIEGSDNPFIIFNLSFILFELGAYQFVINGILKSIKLKPLVEDIDGDLDLRLFLLVLSYYYAGYENEFLDNMYKLCMGADPYIKGENNYGTIPSYKNHSSSIPDSLREKFVAHLRSRLEKDKYNPRICALLAFLDKGDLIIDGMNSKDLVIKAIEQETENPDYYNLLNQMLTSEKYKKYQLETLDQVCKKTFHGCSKICGRAAYLHIKSNNYEKAIKYLNMVLEDAPNDEFYQGMMTYCLIKSGQIDKAVSIYENVMKLEFSFDDGTKLNYSDIHGQRLADEGMDDPELSHISIMQSILDALIESRKYETALSISQNEVCIERAYIYYLIGKEELFKEEVIKNKNITSSSKDIEIKYMDIIDKATNYSLDFNVKVFRVLFELDTFRYFKNEPQNYSYIIERICKKDQHLNRFNFSAKALIYNNRADYVISKMWYPSNCAFYTEYKWSGNEKELDVAMIPRHGANLIVNIMNYYPFKRDSIDECIKKDGEQNFEVLFKYCIAMYYSNKCCEEMIELKKLKKESDHDKYRRLDDLVRSLKKKFDSEVKTQEKLEKEEEISRAKIEERDRVIADLSHHIKNLVKSVIDPLRLCLEKEKNPAIENAIRGADLIRQMVNAMNLTSKGSFADFAHDAKENKGQDAVQLYSVILESLKYSIGNMFDKKYFNVFMAKYMSTRECFDNIKTDWAKVSGSNEIEDILEFCRKHLFDIELKADSSINFMIGNSKGSAIKIMILFQEAILNAVKYAAFVPKDKRKIVISIDSDPQSFRFEVRNSYLPEQSVKGSGLGHIIIKNFCKLLNSEPVIVKTNNEFTLEIKFKNIWSQHENPVH